MEITLNLCDLEIHWKIFRLESCSRISCDERIYRYLVYFAFADKNMKTNVFADNIKVLGFKFNKPQTLSVVFI